jgi:uncharacterized tellurite resistance protein B-like protein
MLTALKDILERAFQPSASDDAARAHGVELATALLLVEVARADYDEGQIEIEQITALLRANFNLSEQELELLIDDAKAQADHAASLHSFTRELHEKLSLAEKHNIVSMLWRVAFSDRHLDRHEDYVVRQIAGLLYVSHSDLIRIRNQVHEEMLDQST